jgi:hypothetical protein
MRGSIRFVLGLLIVFGAVGTLEVNHDASLLTQGIVAALGLMLAKSGVDALGENV